MIGPNLYLRWFGLARVPLIGWVRARIVELGERRCVIRIPLTRRTRNHLEGFSLHADVMVPARRRDQLEKVRRYLVRPPLALDRLTESTGGRLLYHFRRPRT